MTLNELRVRQDEAKALATLLGYLPDLASALGVLAGDPPKLRSALSLLSTLLDQRAHDRTASNVAIPRARSTRRSSARTSN